MNRNRANPKHLGVSVVAALALVATACGSDDDSGADTVETADDTVETTDDTTGGGGLAVGTEMADQDDPVHRVVEEDQREAFLESIGDHRIVAECQPVEGEPDAKAFPIVAAADDTAIVQMTEQPDLDDVGEENVVQIGDDFFVRQPSTGRGDEMPNHVFWMTPIHRGHPVDMLAQGTGYDPLAVGSGGDVVILDIEAGSGSSDYGRHGEFIASLVDAMGPPRHLAPVESQPGNQSVTFDEFAVIQALEIAIEVLENGDLSGQTLVMPFGTYGCNAEDMIEYTEDTAENSDVAEALHQAIIASGATQLVASAGNDGTNQVVYPAAFSDVEAVGSNHSADHRSCFSNFGSWVEYWAIGEEVQASLDNLDYTWSGTSFAAPQVAGYWAATSGLPPEPAAASNLPVKMSTRELVGADPGEYGC